MMRLAKNSVAWSVCLLLAASAPSVWADESQDCDKASEAGQALLTVRSDAGCKLTINDQAQGVLTANQARTVKAAAGQQVVRCASTEHPGAMAEETHEFGGGCGSVTFEVGSFWGRFKGQKGAPFTDSQTGLKWLPADNGADADWATAKKHCEGKGGRLPTEDELRQIHSGGVALVGCGEYSCSAPHTLKLSGRFFWSSTPFEPGQFITVGLVGPRPSVQSIKPSFSQGVRALCVVK